MHGKGYHRCTNEQQTWATDTPGLLVLFFDTVNGTVKDNISVSSSEARPV